MSQSVQNVSVTEGKSLRVTGVNSVYISFFF